MNIESINNGDTVTVKLLGRLDGKNPGNLRKVLAEMLLENYRMVVDCSKLEYMNSEGLGALISCLRIAISSGGDIRLAEVMPSVKIMLELTRADKVFQIHVTTEDAVASFNRKSMPT